MQSWPWTLSMQYLMSLIITLRCHAYPTSVTYQNAAFNRGGVAYPERGKVRGVTYLLYHRDSYLFQNTLLPPTARVLLFAGHDMFWWLTYLPTPIEGAEEADEIPESRWFHFYYILYLWPYLTSLAKIKKISLPIAVEISALVWTVGLPH